MVLEAQNEKPIECDDAFSHGSNKFRIRSIIIIISLLKFITEDEEHIYSFIFFRGCRYHCQVPHGFCCS